MKSMLVSIGLEIPDNAEPAKVRCAVESLLRHRLGDGEEEHGLGVEVTSVLTDDGTLRSVLRCVRRIEAKIDEKRDDGPSPDGGDTDDTF